MATVVAFHAHPDDEVLLTGGTIARLAALFPDPPGRTRFARADLPEAAGRLAALLTETRADLLLSYDAQGGYGHRDHIRVHQVGARAAALAAHRTPVSGGGRSARLFRLAIRLPLPLFRVACGTEWFAEPGGRTGELVPGVP
jgi:LmbE family N-acetylglucosaminyl deacetylase